MCTAGTRCVQDYLSNGSPGEFGVNNTINDSQVNGSFNPTGDHFMFCCEFKFHLFPAFFGDIS
jgi:hypothetical protein